MRPTQRSPRPGNQHPMTMDADEGTYQNSLDTLISERHNDAQGRDETKGLDDKHLCVCLRKNLRENVYGMLLVYFNVIFHGNCSKLIWDYWELHRQDAWINVIKNLYS